MSFVADIETRLLALDTATFERLGNQFFHRRGEGEVLPGGLVAGRKKTARGTPDTRIRRPDGRFCFVQYTTQASNLEKKLADDLSKCFQSKLTKTSVTEIAEVILCHLGRLPRDAERELAKTAAAQGVALRIIGIMQLANELYGSHPQLVDHFLNIKVDTGQVLTPGDFVALYDRGPLATPLTTGFRLREPQVDAVLSAMECDAVVLITGRPGVGKTRLALECCRRFHGEHADAQTWCILHRGADLFQDLANHFRAPGHYVIMVDDANQVSRFQYVVELLRQERTDRRFTVVATVRDYACDGVIECARQLREPTIVDVPAMSDDDIRGLLRDEFTIINSDYVEPIIRLALGNARLAVMAAEIVREHQTLESIADTTELYDRYYRSVRRDLHAIGDQTVMRAAAALAYFGAAGRTATMRLEQIEQLFGVAPQAFWEAVQRLYEFELVDILDNDIVRVADQVLATYLFYLAAFVDSVIDLSDLLDHALREKPSLLINVLNPIFAFADAVKVRDLLKPPVAAVRRLFEARGDRNALASLAEALWFVDPIEALKIAREEIQAEPADAGLDSAGESPIIEAKQPGPLAPALRILSSFGEAGEADARIALEFLIDYAVRHPSQSSLVVHTLVNAFGIGVDSHRSGHASARWAVEILARRSNGGANRLVTRILLAFARSQLRTHFDRTRPGRGATLYILDVCPAETPALREYREALWQVVREAFGQPALRDEVLGLLEEYVSSNIEKRFRDVLAGDACRLISFIDEAFDPKQYRHAALVMLYAKALDAIGVPYDKDVVGRFASTTTGLAELLLYERFRKAYAKWEQFDAARRSGLASLADRLDRDGVRKVISEAITIRENCTGDHRRYQIGEGVVILLQLIAERQPGVFADEVMGHVCAGNVLELHPRLVVPLLSQACGSHEAHRRLTETEFVGRRGWLVAFYAALPVDGLTESLRTALVELYETAGVEELRHSLFDMIKFTAIDDQIMHRLLRSLVQRVSQDPRFGVVLDDFFVHHLSMKDDILTYFGGDMALMTAAYLAAIACDPHADPTGAVFDVLLNASEAFPAAWVSFIAARWGSRIDDARDYAFLWRRSDAQAVMQRMVEAIQAASRTQPSMRRYLRTFFVDGREEPHDGIVAEQEDAFLDALIVTGSGDADLMEVVFEIAASLSADRQRARMASFLERNTDIEAFTALELVPRQRSHWGSLVPVYDAEAKFLQSIVPLVEKPELFDHRLVIQRAIDAVQARMEQAKRMDWLER